MNAQAPITPAALAPTPPEVAPRRFASRRAIVVIALALIVAAAGVLWLLSPATSASTDDAYTQADSTTVAPRVKGLVAAVLVAHNQTVAAGTPLIRIDPEEFDARVATAAADLADAQAAVAAADAALASQSVEQRLAQSQVRVARTAIAAADAESATAQADRQRFQALIAQGFATRRDVDRFNSAAVAARSEAERSRASLDVTRDQSDVTAAHRATLAAARAKALASVARARAALTLAQQDQRHTLIRAPIAGVVGDRQVHVGDYVQPGTRLMTLVPTRELYVTANFKETQVARMAAGQPARIKVDALSGDALTGTVESFAPGSGSQFSLLPFEPGTGNFTKIVQRVPVRIRLDPGQADAAKLRPGLSATVTVRLGD